MIDRFRRRYHALRNRLRHRRWRRWSEDLVRRGVRLDSSLDGKRLLYWETSPWPEQQALIAHIALAAKARGADTKAVICDGLPVACLNRYVWRGKAFSDWPRVCPPCFASIRETVETFALVPSGMSSLLDEKAISELAGMADEIPVSGIRSFRYKDLSVGAAAHSSVFRYFQEELPSYDERIYRKYLFAALVTAEAGIRMIDNYRPDAVLMTHGIYSTWAGVTEYANRLGIPVAVLIGGYETSFVYIRKLREGLNLNAGILTPSEWEALKERGLSEREENLLDLWFRNRYERSGKFRIIHHPPTKDPGRTLREAGVPEGKPVWAVLTNLYWDGSIDQAPTAYRNTADWISDTLRIAAEKRDVHWIVKVHPGEALPDMAGGASIRSLIKAAYPVLPPNITLLPAETTINPWDLFSAVDGGVLLMGNTSGIELACLGKPVINAGHSSGALLGFSHDGLTKEAYRDLLGKVPGIPPLAEEEQRAARTYAYAYFLRLHIPLPAFRLREDDENIHSFRWNRLPLLEPGRHPVYDAISRSIFGDGSIILPDEVVEEAIKYWDLDYANRGQLARYGLPPSAF